MYEIREQLKVQRESFELELANFIELESSQACEKVELGDKKLLYEKEKLDLDEYKRIKQDMFDQRSDESQVVALRNQVEGLSTQYTIEIARLNDLLKEKNQEIQLRLDKAASTTKLELEQRSDQS